MAPGIPIDPQVFLLWLQVVFPASKLPTHLSDPKFKRSAALVQNKTKRSEEAKAICEKADLLSFPCAAADFDDLVQQNLVGSNGKPLSAEEIEGRKIGEIGGLVSKGMYANQLRGWLALFPRENLHVALFEKFYADGITTSMNQITQFLGLPDHDYSDPGMKVYKWYGTVQRRRNQPEAMSSETRDVLNEVFCEPNRDLERLFSGESAGPQLDFRGLGYACLD